MVNNRIKQESCIYNRRVSNKVKEGCTLIHDCFEVTPNSEITKYDPRGIKIVCNNCSNDDSLVNIYECSNAEEILKLQGIEHYAYRYLCEDCINKYFNKVVEIENNKWIVNQTRK